jgi:hypothetical protein
VRYPPRHSIECSVFVTTFDRLDVIAAQVAATPHIEFHLRWATEILQNHAAWLQVAPQCCNRDPCNRCTGTHAPQQDPSGRQACAGSLRSVQKSLFDCMGELSRLSDSNLHMLRYLVRRIAHVTVCTASLITYLGRLWQSQHRLEQFYRRPRRIVWRSFGSRCFGQTCTSVTINRVALEAICYVAT